VEKLPITPNGDTLCNPVFPPYNRTPRPELKAARHIAQPRQAKAAGCKTAQGKAPWHATLGDGARPRSLIAKNTKSKRAVPRCSDTKDKRNTAGYFALQELIDHPGHEERKKTCSPIAPSPHHSPQGPLHKTSKNEGQTKTETPSAQGIFSRHSRQENSFPLGKQRKTQAAQKIESHFPSGGKAVRFISALFPI